MWDVTITPSWDPASPLVTLLGSPHSWCPIECLLATLICLCTLRYLRLGSDFDTICNDPPQITQYYLLLALSNHTSQEVIHPSTTLAEACLTAEF
jgi:hypothetical protein